MLLPLIFAITPDYADIFAEFTPSRQLSPPATHSEASFLLFFIFSSQDAASFTSFHKYTPMIFLLLQLQTFDIAFRWLSALFSLRKYTGH